MSEAHGYLKHILAHDEEVLRVTRQHWLVLVKHILGSIFFLILTGAVAGGIYTVLIMQKPVLAAAAAFIFLILLIPLVRLAWKILVWRSHMYVMTNRRVIQLSGVLNKQVVDSLLEKVNDVKTNQSLLGRIFNYGDIEILTASETGKNDFRHIAGVLEFKTAMLDAKNKLEHGSPT